MHSNILYRLYACILVYNCSHTVLAKVPYVSLKGTPEDSDLIKPLYLYYVHQKIWVHLVTMLLFCEIMEEEVTAFLHKSLKSSTL